MFSKSTMPFGSLAGALLLMSLSTVSAHADFVTGFEPPSYTLGPLDGQNGWSVFGTSGFVGVETFEVDSGAQAVSVATSNGFTQTGPWHAGGVTGPIVDLSADIMLNSSSDETPWQFAATGANLIGYAGGIDITPSATPDIDTITAISGTSPVVGTLTRNEWNQVNIILNYTSQTFSIVLNGSTLASNLPFCGSNGPCTGAYVSDVNADGFFDSFEGASANDLGVIDNYSYVTVTATPEPAMALPLALLLGMGLALRYKLAGRLGTAKPRS
jgi:hypothetical protein